MSVSGTYDVTIKTPMGDQNTRLTIEQDGDTFTGRGSGAQGDVVLENGKVSGNTITWTMDVTVPMPISLEGTATIEGDGLRGTVKAGPFGTMPLTGSKVS
ncbi:MAG: hypothetical protein V4579_01135 [Pseudomonadota bacterium]